MRQAFQYATGADLDVASMGARHGKHIFRAASFGLTSQGRPINNTFAINLAIRKAAAAPGGGTVVIPEGIYPVYTIVLALPRTGDEGPRRERKRTSPGGQSDGRSAGRGSLALRKQPDLRA